MQIGTSTIHLLVKVGCRRTDIGGPALSQMNLFHDSFNHSSDIPLLFSCHFRHLSFEKKVSHIVEGKWSHKGLVQLSPNSSNSFVICQSIGLHI